MKKFKNQYRIPSVRLQSWDYGQNGAYFVTICTKNRASYFGDVVDGRMQLSQIGQLAERFCNEITEYVKSNPEKWENEKYYTGRD
jgi:putative transposase